MKKRREKDIEQRLRNCRKEYERVKARIQKVGFIAKGTLVQQRLTCGNPNCCCHKDPGKLHGPYYYLSWKEKGKTVGRLLPPVKARLYRDWIDNRRTIAAIMEEMYTISRKAGDCILTIENQKRQRPKEAKKGKKLKGKTS